MRRLVAALVLSTLMLGACADAGDAAPTCDEEGLDAVTLVAQSVPEAELVPCIEALPVRWSLGMIDVKDTGTRLRFDLDGIGRSALHITFTSSCERSGADKLSSDEEGTQLWEVPDSFGERYTANRYYVFDGGCVMYDFDMPRDDTALAQMFAALTFRSRAEIEDAYREFVGLEG